MSAAHHHKSHEELAALYAAGALTDDEARQVEAILQRDDDDAQALGALIRSFEDAAQIMISRVTPMNPDPSVRKKLFDRIRSKPAAAADAEPVWRNWTTPEVSMDALYTLRAGEGAWEETGIDGIDVRRLFVDEANNRMTAMFRMAPGTSYVPHRHDAAEECYVLDGDLHVGEELVLHAGDYQRAEAGSLHGEQWTEGGCLLLITCSLHDEQMYTDDGHTGVSD